MLLKYCTTRVCSCIIVCEIAVPSPPTVSVDPFNHLEMAGQPLTLNCSVSIQEGIRGTPVLTWNREDDGLSRDIISLPPLLSFLSLRTSHAGRYTCTARLIISEAGVDISGIGQQAFLFIVYEIALVIVPTLCIDFTFFLPHSVMPPLPIISGSPRNNSFFQGLDLVFTCSITLGNVVDTPVTIRGTWNRNGTQPINGAEDGRITIINPPMSTPPYDITIRFNPLKVGDNGTYECDVTVTPQDSTFIHSATTSNSRTISVFGMMMILSLC